jgi:hypothetical protein
VNSVPIDLPLKPSEAAALADLIFQYAESRPLTDEIRNRLNGRLNALELTGMVPFMGSLQKDPIHTSAYYIAVDATSERGTESMLLRMALASSPASALFPDPILIGRMRPGGGREIVVNAIPFGATDYQNIRTFADRIDRSFYPRPQGAQSAISVAIERPETGIPAAFEAFRTISRKYGVNWASLTATPGTSSEAIYCTALWAAIRAGWREGYNLTVALPEDFEAAQRKVLGAARFTRFSVPANAERLFDFIQDVKSPSLSSKYFDFELSLLGSPRPTLPEEIMEHLERLKTAGRSAQLIAPKLASLDGVAELAAAARQCNATLSFYLDGNPSEQTLQQIGRATGGRFNVTIDEGPGSRADVVERIVSLAGDLRG